MHEYSPLDENITLHGRTNRCTPLPLFWTASGVEFITDSSYLAFEFETGYETNEQWVRVEVDGFPMIRTALKCGCDQLVVWNGLQKRHPHHVRLFKETQPMPRDPSSVLLLHRILCDGMIHPITPRPFRIEFVGDSISSGEGLAGAKALLDGASLVFSTQGHYALEIARRLNADFRILSQSGWGVAVGWDNDPHHTMPPFYNQVCGVVPGSIYEQLGAHRQHDFTSWVPDIIVAHLGYNDGFALDSPPWTNPETKEVVQLLRGPDGLCSTRSGEIFCQAACSFLRHLRKCNPTAHLVWTYGMFGQVMCPWIEEAIARYKKETGDTNITFILLPDTPAGQIGANNHPGVAAHKVVADILTRKLLPILEARR